MDRKARIREYKETPRPAGVFRVRNTLASRSLLESSPNVPGGINRAEFELENGSHSDKELQKDWDELGSDAFEFETLDLLEPSDDPGADLPEDLRVLKELWIEKLVDAGESLYPHSKRGT